ncbi:hypothetical protein HYC85_001110 [Camellia sinensis]|uniref:TPX2 central domain-containing protein n=1 Tax=Camellia sinensis TaxID=4442 RepID=A0A7J7I5N7_CAMSI|nr:hypothetical protein HYC85_001110 [Camellia sinensis]
MVSQEADTYGDMDEEMEDFVGDYFQDVSEVDFDYEFDAARFFDFTRLESYSEAQDAERWFQSAGTYPPSRPKSRNGMAEDIPKAKIKSVAKSSKIRSSTLMQPTASHLAKLSRGREVHSIRFLERSQKPLTKLDERSLRNPLGVDRDATKRQKLENGYLCKVNLMSRNNSESGEHAKSKGPTFKARPLNRKVDSQGSFIASSNKEQTTISSVPSKLSKLNSESIPKNEATRTERLNCEEASKQEKCKTLNRVKYHPHNKKIVSSKKDVCTFQNVKEEAKELKLLNDDGLSNNPPIELFNKLSLKSELEHNAISPSKPPLHTEGSKENIPGSLKQVVQVS